MTNVNQRTFEDAMSHRAQPWSPQSKTITSPRVTLAGSNGGFLDEVVRKMFLWRRRDRGVGFAGGDGLLSLQLVPLLVGRSGQCLQPVEARKRAHQARHRTCRDVPEDQAQPPAILQQMRRPPSDLPSAARSRRRVCRYAAGTRI